MIRLSDDARFAPRLSLICAAAPARVGDDDRKDRQPGRHRGLAGARAGRAADRAGITPSTAAPARTPPDKPGTANLAADLLDEGAGDLDSKAFHERLERHAIETGFQVGRDYFRGSLRTLERASRRGLRPAAAGADQAAFRRRRGRARARAGAAGAAARDHQSERSRPAARWWETAFPGSSLRPADQAARWRSCRASPPTICATMSRRVLRAQRAEDRRSSATSMPKTAGALHRPRLRRAAGQERSARRSPTSTPQRPRPAHRRSTLDVPQAVVTFGGLGIARNDPDFMAAYIVNHILGGGSFSSRLYREVREKRGLAYGVSDSLSGSTRAAVVIGGTATRADRTGRRARRHRGTKSSGMAAEGPTRRRTGGGQVLSQGLLRAVARHLGARSRRSSRRSRSTISASTTSSAAAP